MVPNLFFFLSQIGLTDREEKNVFEYRIKGLQIQDTPYLSFLKLEVK
jgi:hypothetical protein